MNHQTDESHDLWNEVHRLATLRSSGDMTDADIQRLEGLLSTNDKARRLYVAHVFETTYIASLLQEPLPEPDPISENERTPVLGFLGDTLSSIQSPSILAFSLAVLLTVGTLSLFDMLRLPGSGDGAGIQTASPHIVKPATSCPVSQVATLTGTVDCRWADDLAIPEYGEPIYAGRSLELEEGIAQLTFESGAKLIIQGPATFTTETSMLGTLDRGKLAALVPVRAFGFTVRTPSAEVVDLGTEFGLVVDGYGRTQVDVINGEVVTWPVNRRGDTLGDGLKLTELQSVSYGGKTEIPCIPRIQPADTSKFIREITPRLTDDQLPPLSVRNHLALWLSADVLVSIDENRRVVCWQDILAGDNQTEESAWQHEELNRPLLVDAAIGGKPALHFDGRTSHMVTTPLTTTDDQTVFLVFQRGREPHKKDVQRTLINYNGPPINLAENPKLSPFRILQVDDNEEPGRYRGFVYSSLHDKWTERYGEVRSRTRVKVGEPTILSYVFDTERNRAELFINGQSHGNENAPAGFGVTSRKIFGKHPRQDAYFEGDIAEVLIYNISLGPKAVACVTQYLAGKYSVTLEKSESAPKIPGAK